MKAKIAILGCGNPAQQWHIPTLCELSKRGEIEFVALCDIDEKLAAETGARYGVPHYASLEEMLDRQKDILVVDVVTSDPLHHVLAKKVAEHGKHVLVEKPMAMTLPCCDSIIDACRSNNVHFEVAENYFRWPKQRLIVKLIKEGILGDIVRVYFFEPKRQLPFEPKVTHNGLGRPISGFGKTGGMVMDMGAHRLSQRDRYTARMCHTRSPFQPHLAPQPGSSAPHSDGHARPLQTGESHETGPALQPVSLRRTPCASQE